MPKITHPRYQCLHIAAPDDLHQLIAETLSFADHQRLPDTLGLVPKWLGRKLANPNTFTIEEARKLAQALNMQVSDLALHYGVGLDEMTAGDILNILCEEGYMDGRNAAAAAPSEAIAEDGGRTVASAQPQNKQP